MRISDGKARGAQRAFGVGSYQDAPLEDFQFRNLDIEAASAGSIQFASRWTFENVRIAAAEGSTVEVKDSRDVRGLIH